MTSLREQLQEKTRLNEVMKLELEASKRAASRAHTATHRGPGRPGHPLMTPQSPVIYCTYCSPI